AHEEAVEEPVALLGQEQAHAEAADQRPHHHAEDVVDDDGPERDAFDHGNNPAGGAVMLAQENGPGRAPPAPAPDRPALPQCDEPRIDAPRGMRTSSTMACVSLSGASVRSDTTTMATRLASAPTMPKRRSSRPNHGVMPPHLTMYRYQDPETRPTTMPAI